MIPPEIKSAVLKFLKDNFFMILVVIVCTVTALVSLLWLPKDNAIEQAAEKEIEVLTGLPVDFTP